jgi:rod shape-determining protein MreB and related proteins
MLAKRIGIDLGSSTVQIYVKGVGVVVDEPSLLAVDRSANRIVAIGREAFEMLGRTPDTIEVTWPIQEGSIVDFAATEGMLRQLISSAQGSVRFFRPEVMITVPSGVTSLQRRAMTEAAISGGARQAWLLDEPLAAALGADLAISEPVGRLVCDIGGGTTEIAVISLSGMVVAQSAPVGGHRMDQAIIEHLRRTRGLLIGERTAEEVKIEVGSAIAPEQSRSAEVRGRDMVSGLPRSVTVTSDEIVAAIQAPLAEIVGAVRQALEQTPPELAGDIQREGMVLAGGGALLGQVDRYLSRHTGLPVRVAPDPRLCVARGAGLALDRFDVLRRGQLYLR